MAKVNRRLIAALSAGFLSATALVNVTAGASAHVATAHPHTSTVSTITLKLAKPFSPVAPKGGHDLYHCSLLNPKTTTNEMITSSTFTPGVLAEDHHAILYLVPPADAATAKKLDANGKGWTCFGGPGISGQGSIADLGSAPWLSAWAPGHGPSVEPSGGFESPAFVGVVVPGRGGPAVSLGRHWKAVLAGRVTQGHRGSLRSERHRF